MDLGEIPEPKQIDDQISNIMLTGIGGTESPRISAILAYTLHFEDKDSSVLDMTGLAQKGGAVWSHIKKSMKREIKPYSQKNFTRLCRYSISM